MTFISLLGSFQASFCSSGGFRTDFLSSFFFLPSFLFLFLFLFFFWFSYFFFSFSLIYPGSEFVSSIDRG